MKPVAFILGLLGAAATAAGQNLPAPAPVAPGDLAAFEQFGTAVARSAGIADLGWTDAQFEAFVAGLRAAHEKRSLPVGEPGRGLMAEMQRRVADVRAGERAEHADAQLAQFLRNAKTGAAMQRADSGLLYRIIYPGAGPRPRPRDEVVAHFNAVMPDGKTPLPALSGQGIRMRVGEMPPGVDEALQMIALGGRGVFVIAPHLSFGEGEWPQGVARGTPILLQVEVLDLIPAK
ncbi:MAG TPA: FKBP-type peptidyl-prolyl cis-trans isomerase [Opitutaceae bacterium]|nr:FKBP-type peptidyl-prolyl cis-trans isomerase [Opitutaceae bacterium]